MNFVTITKKKTDVTERELLVSWLYCIPQGQCLTKREKEVCATYIMLYNKALKELRVSKLSKALKCLIWISLWDISTTDAIQRDLHISANNFHVIKHQLKKHGIFIMKDGILQLSDKIIPVFDKNGSITIQTKLNIK